MRIDGILHGRYLVHHLLINCKATGCVYDYQVVAILLCFPDGIFGYLHRIAAALFGIYRNLYL